MSRLTDIKHSIDDYRIAEVITGALQDLSAARMADLRKRFEENARFFFGVRDVYGIVKTRSLKLAPGTDAPPDDRKSALYIAFTSNKRFYGALNRNIAEAFLSAIEHAVDGEFVMVGATGAQYLAETSMAKAVRNMDITDDVPNSNEKERILQMFRSYRRVFAIYPKFINPFRQDVAITEITEVPESEGADASFNAEYIFEPDLTRLVRFFEQQTRYALFNRVLLETELARAAARTLRMHGARDNAHDLRRRYERALRREYMSASDIAMMETFISFNFWRSGL